MRAIDTNLLVQMIARDDRRHALAAEKFIAKGAWVSHLVLAETVWVLESVYNLTPAQIATAVEMLLAHESLALQEPTVVTAALAGFRVKPSVGFTDFLVLEIAHHAGHLPLGTFDKKLGDSEGATRLSG